jgi:hypothetical protein
MINIFVFFRNKKYQVYPWGYIVVAIFIFLLYPVSSYSQSISFEQFFDRINLEYPGMENVKIAVENENLAAAKEELLQYYKNRQDRLFHGILGSGSIPDAQDNLNGYFTIVGHRQYAGDGDGGIDWRKTWSGDSEWHWQFHRMDWLVGIARVYRSTKDPVYAEGWIHLITDWIKNNEPGYPRTLDVGNRLRNWVESYQNMIHVTQSPHISADDHALMLKSMMEQVLFLRDNWRDERNWGASETRGMGQVVTMFPEFNFDDNTDWEYWKDLVLSRVGHHLSIDFHPDGVQVETSPMYHGLEFRNLLQTYSLMEMNGIGIADTLITLFERPAEFMKQITKPDGNYVMIGSADQDSYLNTYLRRAGDIFGRPDFVYVSSLGVLGEPAKEVFKMFPYGGFGIMRDTWGINRDSFRRSKYLLLNFTTNEFFHTHFDMLSIEAYANGRTILIDPGRYSYNTSDRNYYRSTQAHSTITINDRNQQSFVHGFAEGYDQPGYQYLNGFHDGNPFDVQHRRKILFANLRYWIVSDLLTGSGENTYDSRFRLESFYRNHHSLDTETGILTTPDFTLVPSQDFGIAEMENGFVSYAYGEQSPAPVLKYHKEGGLPETFQTVIFPFDDDTEDVQVTRLSAIDNSGEFIDNGSGVALIIEYDDITDYAWFNHAGIDRARFDRVDVNANASFIQTNSAREVLTYHMSSGTRMLYDGQSLVFITGDPANISWHRGSVTIDGDNISDATIYAPDVDTLVLNGEVMEFTQDGDYISLSGNFVSFEAENTDLPEQINLRQNYPNPFNPVTTIQFDIPVSSDIRLEVFDILGRNVEILADEFRSAGTHSIVFDAASLSSGVYIYRLTVQSYMQSRKMTIIK